MPLFDKHEPGAFCWIELAATDPAGAKTFYESLFGWTHTEFPMGPGEVYTTFRHRDRDVGAVFSMQPEQRAQGVPPHWLLYVTVASVDDAVAKASALGGSTVAPAMDIFDMGRMAVLKDPTGGMLGVWQPYSMIGFGIANEPGTFCWGELMTPDPGKVKAFYTGLLGWKTETMPMPIGDYTVFSAGETQVGGMFANPPGHESIPPFWQPYFAVTDCDAVVAKAKAAGGKVFLEPNDVPTVGRIAGLADPQGAAFALLTPSPKT